MLTISSLLWLFCFWLNREGSIISKIGGGCFSSKKRQPVYTPPPPVKLPTADELMQSSINTAKAQQPLGYGARESGLADLAKGTDFYNQFQPTSIEQALSDQYFKNVMPTAENKILNYLSLAGISNSPITARLIGEQYGKTGYDVGSYLANQGNERARYSIASRLNIDPWSITNPLLQAGLNRTGQQGELDQTYNEQVAMSNYMSQMQDFQQQQAKQKAMMTMAGLGIGALGGAFFLPAMLGAAPAMTGLGGAALTSAGLPAMSMGTGAMMGGSLGAGVGGMFGGGSPPISMGDSMSMARGFMPQTQNVWGNTTSGIDMQTMLALMKAGVLR